MKTRTPASGTGLNRESFARFYELYWEKVFGICYHHTHDTVVAEEMVQEIFCSLWERRQELDIKGSPEHYLTRAARYKVVDYFREKVRKQVPLDAVPNDTLHTAGNSTENDILFRDLANRVGSLVDQLPAQRRRVYKLSREKGLNTHEIASSLLISEKTVKNHLTKALGFLRTKLKEFR